MRIIAAAIRTVEDKIYSLPPPNRHCNVAAKIYVETRQALRNGDEKGFLTKCGRFLTRKQAYAVVKANGQLEGEPRHRILTTEDLW